MSKEGMVVREATADYSFVKSDADSTPPGYRQTGAGMIPEDWDTSTVGQEFDIQLGKMLDAEKNSGMLKPYLGNKAVQWDRIDVRNLPKMAMSRADMERFCLRYGDLLVCEGGEVGRAAIWEAPLSECYYQKALHRLRPLRGFNVSLMLAFLKYWSDHGMLSDYVSQTSIAHLTREKFANVPMPVPSPLEQRAITAALSDVDALIAAQEKLIAKKRAIKTAAMQQLLTGKTRLPGFSGRWELKRIGDIGSTYGGLTGKTKADFGIGTAKYIPFLNVMNNVVIDRDNLQSVEVAESEGQNPARKGDLFFNGSSETPDELGMCSVLMEGLHGVYLNSFCFGFRIREGVRDNGLFLAYYFRSGSGRDLLYSLAQGATRYNLSKTNFLKLEAALPGPEEQTAIAAVLADMDAEIAGLEARRDKTKAIKQGMMQELLTGRTRLV